MCHTEHWACVTENRPVTISFSVHVVLTHCQTRQEKVTSFKHFGWGKKSSSVTMPYCLEATILLWLPHSDLTHLPVILFMAYSPSPFLWITDLSVTDTTSAVVQLISSLNRVGLGQIPGDICYHGVDYSSLSIAQLLLLHNCTWTGYTCLFE